ncbi:hypothetical protein K456DRAFT_49036 [Colletotrichum gloeosporioides 23]|nr:hypothetical protein K456DRAFT_49036 [Colletotrichum gloeosporioides 23]
MCVPGCLAIWEVTFLRGAWLFVLDDREEQDLGVGSFLVTFGVGGGDSHDSGIWGSRKNMGLYCVDGFRGLACRVRWVCYICSRDGDYVYGHLKSDELVD